MPTKTSPYSPAELTARKAQLQARLDELNERLAKIEGQLEEPLEQDWNDAAQTAENDEVLEGLGNAGLEEIRAIKAAIDRVDAGTYGICTKSGEVISKARLDLIPWTPFCEDHAH